MLRKTALFSAAVVLSCQALTARADTIAAYNFTGDTFSTGGPNGFFGAIGTVTGTITFDLANADPAQSSGTVGSTASDWQLVNNGGSELGLPPASAVLVSVTAKFQNGVTYTTGSINSLYQVQKVAGGTLGALDVLEGTQQNASADSIFSHFSFGPTASGPGFDANGLPVPFSGRTNSPAITDFGEFTWIPPVGFSQNDTQFTISSLTPATVPLPAAAWLMLSGLVGLGAIGRRRRAAT